MPRLPLPTGFDRPFADPARHLGAPMEGHYWRFSDPAGDGAVVALCGLVRREGRLRAMVALGGAGAPVRWRWVDEDVHADDRRLGLRAGAALVADPERLFVDIGPGARLDLAISKAVPWSRRILGGLGAAHLVPGLQQYWHPHLLGGAASGRLELGAHRGPVEGWSAYAEKNWGRGFPGRWWWGQAQHWAAGDDALVVFAGGGLLAGGRRLPATAVVVRTGDRLLRLVAPGALVRAEVGEGTWRIRARALGTSVQVEGASGGHDGLSLPVTPVEGDAPASVIQVQDGALRAMVRRGRRTLWRGESVRAALEDGRLRDSDR